MLSPAFLFGNYVIRVMMIQKLYCGDLPDVKGLQSHVVPVYQEWGKRLVIVRILSVLGRCLLKTISAAYLRKCDVIRLSV
jgi:hypothetical protein